jgi:predicted tellurium resistance membrane protein TerC
MDELLNLVSDPAAWAALVTLIVMEVVLGIDNLIFISILSNKLPEAQRVRTQRIGITLAMVMRLGLLATIAWIERLTPPVFSVFGNAFSWRDMSLRSTDENASEWNVRQLTLRGNFRLASIAMSRLNAR